MGRRLDSLLLVSYYIPGRGHGGGLRLLDLYSLLRMLFPQARLDLAAVRPFPCDTPEAEVIALFDNIYLLDPSEFHPEGFEAAGVFTRSYDVVDLQYLQSGNLISPFRKAGAGKIIFSPMESMVRSLGTLFRDFRLTRGSLYLVWRNLTFAAQELSFVFAADRVLCVSNGDAKVLQRFRWWGGVSAIETGVSPLEFPESLSLTVPTRVLDHVKCIVFVAFFGSATNVDALKWYLRDVHPLILHAVPEYRFHIVGRGLGADATQSAIQAGSVDVIGGVKNIEPYLKGAWVGIAPALSGAGLRGKINQYAVTALPCVASSLAADGLAYQDGESICLAADAQAFAKHCITLLSYPAKNIEMGLAAKNVCLTHYAWKTKTNQILRVYGEARGADSLNIQK